MWLGDNILLFISFFFASVSCCKLISKMTQQDFHNSVIFNWVCVHAEEAERFYEDLQDLLELTPKIDVHFIIGDWNAKVRKNTWSNRQIWPWSTEWSRLKVNRVLPKECTGHSKQPFPTTQEKTLHMDITEIILIIFFTAKEGEALYNQQKQDQQLTVAQTMNSLLPNSDFNWRK